MALEVTVISAEDLTIKRRHVPTRKSPFVTVHTDSGRSSAITKPDPAGGSYPEWNQRLSVDIPARCLTVEVSCSDNRVVGKVTIPKSDFTGGYLPADYLHFLSYRLRDHRGEANGIINISVRSMVPSGGGAMSWSRPWIGASTRDPISSVYCI